jgi:beta-N-acetylhexosaminidase
VGVNLDFAPVADVNSNPDNPVIADRSFGSDPRLVARHVAAFVSGLQSEGVGATLKHFPGHGDTDVDSHLALPTLRHDAGHLEAVDLPPFRAGIAAGAAAIMSAHILMPEIDASLPATLSRTAMHGLLRTHLGFRGVIVTDALDMRAIKDTWPAPQAAVMSLKAGTDLPVVIGGVDENRAVLDEVDAAAADGRLDPAEYAASQARVAALADRFAAGVPNPGSAWRADGSDETLLSEAAFRGLVVRGEPPVVRRGDRVILVARQQVFTNAAAQVTVRPADTFATALAAAGIEVTRFAVADLSLDEVARAANTGARPAAIVFASTTRVRIKADEVASARALADVARVVNVPFLHVALWNPYSADGVPGPAIIAFGHAPREAAAVVRRLTVRPAGA